MEILVAGGGGADGLDTLSGGGCGGSGGSGGENTGLVFGQNLLRDCPQVDNLDFINAGDDEEQAGTHGSSLVSAMNCEENLSIFVLPSSVFQA